MIHLIYISLFVTLTYSFQFSSCIPLNLPERNAYGEAHLIATLTNQKTGDVTYMEEYLSTKDLKERGKIEVTRNGQSYSIFYNEKDDFRLVMTDNECIIYKYNQNNWNKMLPRVDNVLENILIMFGPTIYYRIQAMLIETSLGDSPLFWEPGPDIQIRGLQTETTVTVIERVLNVTVYKQGLYTHNDPYRVDFQGYLPGTFTTSSRQQYLTIDFYLIETVEDLSYQVAPIPGIGCNKYLEDLKSFPSEKNIGLTGNFHFTAVEISMEGNQIPLEVFVDSPAKIVRYIVDYGQTLLETIYDYNLGISYTLEQPQCVISAMTVDDVGVINGTFNVKELLWQRGDFQYLGKFFYKHRSGIICDVWEKTDYGYTFEGTKYDKVVTTQYFSLKTDISGFIPYNGNQTPIGMTRSFYNLLGNKSYHLEKFIRRDIYDFVDSIAESQYETLFQIADCDIKDKGKLWLQFELLPIDSGRAEEAIKTAEQNLITLREGVRDNIIRSIAVSPLRVAAIDFDFSKDSINANIMFLEKPEMTDALIKQLKRIDQKSIQPYSDKFESLSDCVYKVAYHTKRSISFAWCKDSNNDQLCAPVENVSSLEKSSKPGSIDCEIYSHPVGDLRDVVAQFSLSSLHDALLEHGKNTPIVIRPVSDDKTKVFKFAVTNVIYSDVTSERSRLLFTKLYPVHKLNSDHPAVYNPDSMIVTLGDCYHICESSNIIDCTAFSFCVNPKDQSKVSCLLTSHIFTISNEILAREAIEADGNCDVYGKNHILDYVKIRGQQIISNSIGELSVSPDECAAKCAASTNCKSFDYCDQSICTLSDKIYSVKWSKPNVTCDSYMLKKTENFKITGTNLVDNVIFVEEGINLDQCASLCYDYNSGDDKCLSFNYCPKGRSQSTCQLSQSKVLSKSNQDGGDQRASSIVFPSTTKRGNCFNYVLIEDSKVSNNPSQGGTSTVTSAGGGLLALVMVICLVVGFIYGFVGEYIYLRVSKQLPMNVSSSAIHSSTFSWSRQVDQS